VSHGGTEDITEQGGLAGATGTGGEDEPPGGQTEVEVLEVAEGDAAELKPDGGGDWGVA
jgi:hypothetical protein